MIEFNLDSILRENLWGEDQFNFQTISEYLSSIPPWDEMKIKTDKKVCSQIRLEKRGKKTPVKDT